MSKGRHPRRSRSSSLCLLSAATALCLALPATAVPAASASPRSTPAGRQLAALQGADIVAGDAFGVSVAISGAVAIVGAPGYAKDVGRVYVFAETASGWKQSAELQGAKTVGGDFFGYSVAVSGTTAVVGAPGYSKNIGLAYVFTKTGSAWRQTAELKASDTASNDFFGDSVAVSGKTAVVGADGRAKSAGRAYVFSDTAGSWKQVAELKGSDSVAKDGFGYTVGVSGTTAVAGAPDHAKNQGRAYVFSDASGSWKQIAELKGSDTAANNGFGVAVAISGMSLVAGAPGYAKAAGRAYVFDESGSAWKQVAELKGSDTAASDDLGYAVGISGTTAVAGAPGFAKQQGRTYLFSSAGTVWKQTAELKGSDSAAGDFFGYSVAVSANAAVAGADGHAKSAGRAYLFAP
jgi:hypothetical protein